MSKRRKLEVVDPAQDRTVVPIDWELCIVCQTTSNEPLVHPTLAGYESLINRLEKFAEHNALPTSVRLQQMNDGSGTLSTLSKNGAKYHKQCRNRYDDQKLSRLLSSLHAPDDTAGATDCSSFTTRSSSASVDIKTSWLFCDGPSLPENNLVSACTKKIGPKIHAQAVEMQHTKLLAKMASTDFIALEVKYHRRCYIEFRNSCRSQQRAMGNNNSDPYRLTYGSVISELVQYMQDVYMYNSTAPVFKLSELTKLVAERMTSLSVTSDDQSVNRTRLKEQLLELIPGLREDKCGREVLLTFEPDVGDAIREACEYNDMTDGMCIARAARILRRDLFGNFPKFDGSLSEGFCPENSAPPSLVSFLTTLLGGYNIDGGSPVSSAERTAACSIAQLIRFNSVKRQRPNTPAHTRHQVSHETPLTVYVGLMLHSATRKKSLVDKMNSLGLSVSYSRVQEIEATVTNAVCHSYRSLGDVVPVTLSQNVFTTAAIDNIDHNSSSTTAQDSFHGSSVSVIQHPDSPLPPLSLQLSDVTWSRKITSRLPDTYTCIPAMGNVMCEMPVSTVNTSSIDSNVKPLEHLGRWLRIVEGAVSGQTEHNSISFAAYHSTSSSSSSSNTLLTK